MSYYPTPGAPYVPQQPVNPYGGMGTVGLTTPLPNTQMQQAQPQRPQPMNWQQPVQRNINCDPNDFWAVMNMMYSDYCQVAKRQSVDTPGFYADMAKAFLEDADAADGKAYLYWDCIADK